MKKIVLAAVSAKYIHSSLALRYLSRFADNGTRHNLQTIEFTINQRLDFIADEFSSLAISGMWKYCVSCVRY